MKKSLKLIFVSLLIIMTFFMMSKVKAATTQLSPSPTSVTEGDTINVKVTVNAAQWNLTLTANGKALKTWTETVNYKENLSKTFSVSYKTTEKGTVKFVLSGDITDVDQTNTEINTSKSVTVKAKTTTSSGGSSSGSSSSSSSGSTSSSGGSTTTKTPKFSSVNQTVYATEEVNVRKSYSTSSTILGTLSKGDSVKRTGIGDNGWSKVTYRGQTAYISSSYLSKTKPVIEKPVEKPAEEPKPSTNTTTNETINEVVPNNEIGNNTVNNVIDNNIVDQNVTDNEVLRLSKLEIAGVNFTDGFNPETYSYELKLNFFVDKLNLTAVANKEDAKIEIIGNENFKEGENNITVLVKSADGKETVTYQINVLVPSEVENNPQNNLQFYLICGGIILVAIVAIIVVIVTYKVKNRSYLEDEEEVESYKLKTDEQYNEEKPRRTRGKHSN